MKTNISRISYATGLMAAALLSACQSEDFGVSSQEVRHSKYDRDFIETFGQPANGHQWGYDLFGDNVTRATVDGAPVLMGEGPLKSGRIMCEDMGGKSSDFDFNDIVYDVAFNGTLCYVTLQAAGGTLPLQFYYGNKKLMIGGSVDEIHAMFGAETTSPVNVGAENGATGNAITWVLGFGGGNQRVVEIDGQIHTVIPMEGDFDISKFAVRVNAQQSEWINVSNMTSTTPLCICVPLDVCWAKEGKRIDKAYPGFTNWVQDESAKFWTGSDIDGSLLCSPATSPLPEIDEFSDPGDWNLAPRR